MKYCITKRGELLQVHLQHPYANATTPKTQYEQLRAGVFDTYEEAARAAEVAAEHNPVGFRVARLKEQEDPDSQAPFVSYFRYPIQYWRGTDLMVIPPSGRTLRVAGKHRTRLVSPDIGAIHYQNFRDGILLEGHLPDWEERVLLPDEYALVSAVLRTGRGYVYTATTFKKESEYWLTSIKAH